MDCETPAAFFLTIATYLLTGVVPTRQAGNHSDKVCPPPVPQPGPTAGSSVASGPAAALLASRR